MGVPWVEYTDRETRMALKWKCYHCKTILTEGIDAIITLEMLSSPVFAEGEIIRLCETCSLFELKRKP